MPLAISIGIILVLLVVMWVAFAKETGPGAPDVAIAYERAWDRFDFDLLYDLSGPELRDGMRRDQFLAAKRAAYARTQTRHRVDATIGVDDVVSTAQTAVVLTHVANDEGSVQNRVLLEKRSNGWTVVGYSIRTA